MCSSWVGRQILLYWALTSSGATASAVHSQNTDPSVSEVILRKLCDANAQSFLSFQFLFQILDLKMTEMYISSYLGAQGFNDLT